MASRLQTFVTLFGDTSLDTLPAPLLGGSGAGAVAVDASGERAERLVRFSCRHITHSKAARAAEVLGDSVASSR